MRIVPYKCSYVSTQICNLKQHQEGSNLLIKHQLHAFLIQHRSLPRVDVRGGEIPQIISLVLER
jgi:hypothetical protein